MTKIVIFASGAGTNAEAIIKYFSEHEYIRVVGIVSNKASAGVLQIASEYGIQSLIIPNSDFGSPSFLGQLSYWQPSLIVLAGFLRKIPDALLEAYPDSIINIHPALLPKYGGKGMYGASVHQAVIASKDIQSGITIHRVNANYDEGAILLQATCARQAGDTAESLARSIHELEHWYYPRCIEFVLKG